MDGFISICAHRFHLLIQFTTISRADVQNPQINFCFRHKAVKERAYDVIRNLAGLDIDGGFPTLRLIRFSIGNLKLKGLKQGEFREIKRGEIII